MSKDNYFQHIRNRDFIVIYEYIFADKIESLTTF